MITHAEGLGIQKSDGVIGSDAPILTVIAEN